jgi:Rrf2 family protein
MKLSTRVRYGLRALIELAKQPDNSPVPLRQLAQNQQISPKYLEQMAAIMKTAGLIESVRGADGGYRLAKPPQNISVWDVYKILDTEGALVDCRKSVCERVPFCATQEVWADLNQAIRETLQTKNLKELAEREKKLTKTQGTSQ